MGARRARNVDNNNIAIAFGTFDILHPGHIKYLSNAAKHGKLTVVIARDESVNRIKGVAPIMDERSRKVIVGSLKFVHKAILGNRTISKNGMYRVLKKIRPNTVVLGYDQKIDENAIQNFASANKLEFRLIRLKPYMKERFKSSKFKQIASDRIRHKDGN